MQGREEEGVCVRVCVCVLFVCACCLCVFALGGSDAVQGSRYGAVLRRVGTGSIWSRRDQRERERPVRQQGVLVPSDHHNKECNE